MEIEVFGTIEEPLFKITDIMEKLLGYRKANSQRWFSDILKDNELVANCNLTEEGLYECLFASKQPIAKKFKRIVRR